MGTFLWLSDFHLDPYYGSPSAASRSGDSSICAENSTVLDFPFGHVGCDAPITLVTEMLTHITSTNQDASIDFVLVTGDFARHGTDRLDDGVVETTKMLSTISTSLKQAFPSIPVIPSIGNNDVFPDYFIDLKVEGGDNRILNISIEGFRELFESEEELMTFSLGGYFARNVTNTLTIVSLNTVMYSANHSPDQTDLDDPMGQFQWLENQLDLAMRSGRFVYILAHIPPTVGSYRQSQFWHSKYMDRYFSILQAYHRNVVKGHLFGHLHSDEFRLLHPFTSDDWNANVTIPLYIASSVTPVYGSNPSYRLVRYEPDSGELLDYQTFFLDLEKSYRDGFTGQETTTLTIPSWITETPSFVETYDLNSMSSNSLQDLLVRLSAPWETSQPLWEEFLKRQYVYSSDDPVISCDDSCQAQWLCTLQAISRWDYDVCILNVQSIGTRNKMVVAASAALIGALSTVCCFWCFIRCRKRRQFLQIDQTEQPCDRGASPGDIESSSPISHGGNQNVVSGELT